MTTTVMLPAEIFVEHVLVLVRDADVRIPGSSLRLCEHARQAAALAQESGQPDAGVAAALLYGTGYAHAQAWGRHPSMEPGTTPYQLAVAHLEIHLPENVTAPIAMLPRARRYLERRRSGLFNSVSARRFEAERHASAAIELAAIDRRAGHGPMITPEVWAYRQLLTRLCRAGSD